VIGYLLWLVFVLSWAAFDRFTGDAQTLATPADRSSSRTSKWGTGGPGERAYGLVIALGLVMIIVAPATLPTGRIWANPPIVDWAMLLIILAGVAECWWARLHLGRLWSSSVTRKEGHRVVDTGPYRLVRHPIYSGFILIYLGMGIICATALSLLAVPVITFGLWLKARVEERFLVEELGAGAYGAYQATTPMLVPRVRHARPPCASQE
jgi:protein-S-isoprenylcysteine O-methyltransferase Ste14